MEFRYRITAKVESGGIEMGSEHKFVLQGIVMLWVNGEDIGNAANVAWPLPNREWWDSVEIDDILTFPIAHIVTHLEHEQLGVQDEN